MGWTQGSALQDLWGPVCVHLAVLGLSLFTLLPPRSTCHTIQGHLLYQTAQAAGRWQQELLGAHAPPTPDYMLAGAPDGRTLVCACM